MKLSDLHVGQTVYLDDGFDCHPGGAVEVLVDEDGVYFECSHGRHYFDGQVNSIDKTLIGVIDVNSFEE